MTRQGHAAGEARHKATDTLRALGWEYLDVVMHLLADDQITPDEFEEALRDGFPAIDRTPLKQVLVWAFGCLDEGESSDEGEDTGGEGESAAQRPRRPVLSITAWGRGG